MANLPYGPRYKVASSDGVETFWYYDIFALREFKDRVAKLTSSVKLVDLRTDEVIKDFELEVVEL